MAPQSHQAALELHTSLHVLSTRTPIPVSTPLLPQLPQPHQSRRGRFMSKQPKEQALNTDKITDGISPGENWSVSWPDKAAAGCLHSGSQVQSRRNIQKMMIMSVFKTCPFLPSPGQYLQSRHANKQTFFQVQIVY